MRFHFAHYIIVEASDLTYMKNTDVFFVVYYAATYNL